MVCRVQVIPNSSPRTFLRAAPHIMLGAFFSGSLSSTLHPTSATVVAGGGRACSLPEVGGRPTRLIRSLRQGQVSKKVYQVLQVISLHVLAKALLKVVAVLKVVTPLSPPPTTKPLTPFSPI